MLFFFFSSRRRHTRCSRDWSSDVCSSDLPTPVQHVRLGIRIPLCRVAGPNVNPIENAIVGWRRPDRTALNRRLWRDCESRRPSWKRVADRGSLGDGIWSVVGRRGALVRGKEPHNAASVCVEAIHEAVRVVLPLAAPYVDPAVHDQGPGPAIRIGVAYWLVLSLAGHPQVCTPHFRHRHRREINALNSAWNVRYVRLSMRSEEHTSELQSR